MHPEIHADTHEVRSQNDHHDAPVNDAMSAVSSLSDEPRHDAPRSGLMDPTDTKHDVEGKQKRMCGATNSFLQDTWVLEITAVIFSILTFVIYFPLSFIFHRHYFPQWLIISPKMSFLSRCSTSESLILSQA